MLSLLSQAASGTDEAWQDGGHRTGCRGGSRYWRSGCRSGVEQGMTSRNCSAYACTCMGRPLSRLMSINLVTKLCLCRAVMTTACPVVTGGYTCHGTREVRHPEGGRGLHKSSHKCMEGHGSSGHCRHPTTALLSHREVHSLLPCCSLKKMRGAWHNSPLTPSVVTQVCCNAGDWADPEESPCR